MDIKQLKKRLDLLPKKLNKEGRYLLSARLHSLVSIFPFNEYEYTLMFLLDKKVLDFKEYEKLRREYVSDNKYLNLFGLAPRIFGQIWGQEHLMDLDKRFQKPTRELDKNFTGEYDLWINGIKVEVKAARAINTKIRGDLITKALSYGTVDPFWMNFQQIKFDTCDVFVFIGVWIGQISYWVLSIKDVKTNKYLSHQHRGGVEYQIGITDRNLAEFDKFQVAPLGIADAIIKKGKKQI